MNTQVKGRKKLTATNARNLRTLLLLNVLAPEQIGARLAQARLEAGLTQEELADLVGVSTRSLQGYEAGDVKPYRHLEALAEATGVAVAWLLHGGEDSTPLGEALAERMTGFEERLDRILVLLEAAQEG